MSAGGMTVASTGASLFNFTTTFAPYIQNNTARNGGPPTITFESDKNDFSVGVAILAGGTFTYSAQNAAGVTVASGVFKPTIAQAGAIIGQLNISGPVFRKVVLTPSLDWAIDNIRGACR